LSTQFDLCLRLHSGVPVLDVLGSWGPPVADAVSDMVAKLTTAGHFEIVVNVQKCLFEGARDGVSTLRSLAISVSSVRSHFGHLDLVGTEEQVSEIQNLRDPIPFRLSSSEEAAIGRIKRMPVFAAGSKCTSRPAPE
jgi:hypothetical protein